MRSKIILSLLALFFLFAAGSIMAMVYIRNTTDTLERLIQLHQIEDFRKNLVISIQTVQAELYAAGTMLAHGPDIMTESMLSLQATADRCSSCHNHHTADIVTRIGLIQTDIKQYGEALSAYLTAPDDDTRVTRLKLKAAETGNRLLTRTEEMSIEAAEKLASTTSGAMYKINDVQAILYVTLALAFIAGILIAVNLTRAITRPIDTLVTATRALAKGDLTHTIQHADRTEFGELADHFNTMSAALRDGYAKLQEEISERKHTEAALAGSEQFLHTIFNSIRDPFCIIDRSFHVVRANDAYAEMKGVELPKLIGSRCYSVLYDRDAVCEDCIVETTFRSGEVAANEKSSNGTGDVRIWHEVYTYPIQDDSGATTHVIEYSRDITERKRTESKLRESEERYALAARGANDGLWDWDLRTNRVHYSFRWKTMLGYSERELTDHPEEWFSRVHPDDREELEAKIAAHLDGRNPHFESEFRIMHGDGTFHWMLSRGLAVRDSKGHATRVAGSQTDITLRKKAEEQLVYDAFHDALTGLPNRALFMDRLRHTIVSSERNKEFLFAVLFLDMDRFKVVNDSLGHTIGDQLLVIVAKKLTDCLRPGDTVARLGGDEFAILLENIRDQRDAIEIADRIHQALAAPLLIKGSEIFTSSSIGIAFSSQAYERPEHILRDADIAMYQAKVKGRATYEVFDSKMHANILDRLELEADLRRAVDRQELLVHYQPIINVASRELTGFEALIRWNHPKRGMVFPMEFIPLAEENGFITVLGEWAMREACRQLAVWQQQYLREPPLKMSLNISAKQFSQSDLVEKLVGIIEQTGVSPACLALEITETMIMDDIDRAISTMTRLRDLGFHIHIDDFGTGYSSLSYLHRFPITALKIDRSFVSKLTEHGDNKEIITSIITLADSLNLSVIAEGVEQLHQLSHMKEMHCGFAQGYLFSKPISPAAMDEWIKNSAA